MMGLKKLLLCPLLGILLAGPAWAESFVDVQHAGYAGNAALGVGYTGTRFGADALYGWTPKRLAGRNVQSFTFKGLWYLFMIGQQEQTHVRPYLGLAAFYSPDDELFLRLPDQYPEGYYVPSALRPALVSGLRLQMNRTWGVSLEYAVLDTELAYIKDKGGIAYNKVGSVGFAVHYKFSVP